LLDVVEELRPSGAIGVGVKVGACPAADAEAAKECLRLETKVGFVAKKN
jgi:hypothetical protein